MKGPEQIIAFSESPELATEVTFSALTPGESALVSSVASWKQPDRYTDLLRQAHGRSLVYQSPDVGSQTAKDYMLGSYDGLQIIGAGGTTAAIREGIFTKPDSIPVCPPDPANHTKELELIIEQHDVDKEGHLILWNRPYAPMHGMDEPEAMARKSMTARLQAHLSSHLEGELPMTLIPKLAMEGYYPDKLDPAGRPLVFQVYRVPLIDRFPQQFLNLSQTLSIEGVLFKYITFSYLAGRNFEMLHSQNLAYMDGHLGNMSLVQEGKMTGLYITDLGSMRDMSGHPYKNRYKGYDLFVYLTSARNFAESFVAFASQHSMLTGNGDGIRRAFMNPIVDGLIAGYFQGDMQDSKHFYLAQAIESARPRSLDIRRILSKIRQQDAMAEQVQHFMELFEEYLH